MMEKLMQYIARDPVYYAGMRAALAMPGTKLVYAAEDGVLLRCGWLELVGARTQEAAARLLPLLCCDDALVHDGLLEGPLMAMGCRRDLVCYSGVYEKTEPIAFSLPAGVDIRRLSHDYDAFVLAHYSHAGDDAAYVPARIDAGMYGLFENGALAGFIGVHDTGEMGLLEILPAYRRKGYASLLEAHLINRRLAEGHLPYCEVETWNEPSLNLQRRLGVSVSEATCAWFLRPERA